MRSRNVSPGLTRDAHDQPVRQHARAAGDGAASRRRPRGSPAPISPVMALSSTEATPSITSPSSGIDVAGLDQHDVALAQLALHGSRCAVRAAVGARRASWPRRLLARLRSDVACALPRPSAIASAKLANSTVNHSQSEIARMKPGRRLAVADAAPGRHSSGGQHAADVDDEHDRVAQLHARVELGERRRRQRRLARAAGRTACELSACDRLLMAMSLISCRAQHQVLDDGPERQRRHERSAAPTSTTVPTSSDDEQRAVRGQRAGRRRQRASCRQRAGDRQDRHDQPEAAEPHRDAEQRVVERRVGGQPGEGAAVVVGRRA